MWDRFVNFVYDAVRELSNTTFYIIVAVVITLGFYFVGNFLKANKKTIYSFYFKEYYENEVKNINNQNDAYACLMDLNRY